MRNKVAVKERSVIVAVFLFAVALVAIYIKDINPIISGDATSIWNHIISMDTDNPVGSYVLYKGILSVYPYRWFYQWAMMLNLPDFFFIKMYHCLLFAYISVIGLPNIYIQIRKKPVTKWRRLLLMILCFGFWRSTFALSQLMVDLPSAAVFIAGVSVSLTIFKGNSRYLELRFFELALLCGVGLCFSGQYSLSTLMVIIYSVLSFQKNRKNERQLVSNGTIVLTCILFAIPIITNQYYFATTIRKLIENGAWIPEGSLWVMRALTLMMGQYSYFNPIGVLSCTRGVAVLTDFAGSDYANSIIQQVSSNYLSIVEVLQMWFTHLPDMLVIWFGRLFLLLSPDNGAQSIPYLIAFYTAIFTCLMQIKEKIIRIGDLLHLDTMIFCSVLLTALVPCAMGVEMRFALSIQGFILAFSVLDDKLWRGIKKRVVGLKRGVHSGLQCIQIDYSVVTYVAFILMCFMIFGLLHELEMGDRAVLFSFTL